MNNEFKAVPNLLRSIYSVLVIRNGGLVLHASGILRGDKAYIFFGPSESGKSTVANLSSDFTILDDDSIYISKGNKISNGMNNCYNASGRRVKGNFPIRGLYKLTKDKEVYLEKLTLSRALSELFTIPALLNKRLNWHEKLLVNISGLVAEVPCFDLHFKKDNSFWQCIDGHTD